MLVATCFKKVEALFDIKFIDTDALHRTPGPILDSGALEIKKLYKKAVEDRQGTFTPFATSVDVLLHREAEHFFHGKMRTHISKYEWSNQQIF